MAIFQNSEKSPSWRITHEKLATVTRNGDSFRLDSIRDFRYPTRTEDDPRINFRNETVALSHIESAWIAIIPFRPHFAHVITSFGTADGTFISVSIEIRYRKGEPYRLAKTFLPHYWISYVIATEDDVFRIRTDVRHNEPVHLYRLAVSQIVAQNLFCDMMLRAQKVNHDSPERFHSVWNSCTSNVLTHIGRALGTKLPLSPSWYLTDTLDTYLAGQKLLALDKGSLPESRARYCINERARETLGEYSEFSTKIRM